MMPSKEDLFERVLTGTLEIDAPEVRRTLAEHPEWAEELNSLCELQAGLAAIGRDIQEERNVAAAIQSSPAENMEAAIRRAIVSLPGPADEEDAFAGKGPADAARSAGAGGSLWLRLAAALFVGVSLFFGARFLSPSTQAFDRETSAPGGAPAQMPLGDEVAEAAEPSLHPSGEAASFAEFRWPTASVRGANYRVRVYRSAERGEVLGEFVGNETVWRPAAALIASWPDEVYWELEVRDAMARTLRIESSTARTVH